MSDTMRDEGPAGEEPEVLAAEYVLGTLDALEADAAAQRISVDAVFAGLVSAWERRLYPLVALVTPIPAPPGLWTRIEDSTGGAATPAFRGAGGARPANDNAAGWRITALASMAVAAGLAAFIVLRPPPRPIVTEAVISHPIIAVLSPAAGGAYVLVAVADPAGALRIRATGSLTVPEGRDLQLWSLPPGATKPASLGVLPSTGTQVPGGVAISTQLLVSLEPKGGSPTGQPTGPVLYAGKLAPFE